MGHREYGFSAETGNALPAAQHCTQRMKPALQDRKGAGNCDKDGCGHGSQQRNGSGTDAEGYAVEVPGTCTDANAQKQRNGGVDPKDFIGGGGTVIGVHKVLHLSFSPEKSVITVPVIRTDADAVQANGFAHGVQLIQCRISALIRTPQGHGHFQTESGTAGNFNLLQADNSVCATGEKCKE